MRTILLIQVLVMSLGGVCARADLKLHGLFTDGAVLQQNRDVPVEETQEGLPASPFCSDQ